ncbi:D-alanyl-D-alanine carboxypeptidase [Candidatus Daviesbacteria bacterium]|nr:D-alanyl-D-alanine carboxypeptidase [Candidatus Daviesbacteria bacterium]
MLTTRSIRIFSTGLLLTFLMVVMPHLGISKRLINPMPKPVGILEQVKTKLETRQNYFQIKKQLISAVFAGSDYEEARAYTVADLSSGQIITAKNPSKRLPVASLTKIMTAIVALDLTKPDEKFSVSEKAASQIPTKVMLKEGEVFSILDLLKHMLISSANDSAEVIKEGIDLKYEPGTFIKAMNLKAQILGLKNTHFTNAEGYDDSNHFSSTEDLTTLSAYALKEYPEIAQIVSKPFEDLTKNATDLRFYLNNWNGLIGVYPNVSGVKIGNTGKAGHSTIVVSEREGSKILAVLLGAPGVLERDLWTAELLDLGFNKVAGLKPVGVTEDQLQSKYETWKYFK